MIFIILGTQKFQLNRLLQLIDGYCEKKLIKEEVFAQIGNSDYIPKNFKWKKFLEVEEFKRKIKESSIVISHGGVGSIMTAINNNIPVIVFPRLKKFNEHIDDHQLDITNAFFKKNLVTACYEEDKLIEKIDEAKEHRYDKYVSSREEIIKTIEKFLEEN